MSGQGGKVPTQKGNHNHADQCNPTSTKHQGYDRHFQGDKKDADNHGVQLNPNNDKYTAPKK